MSQDHITRVLLNFPDVSFSVKAITIGCRPPTSLDLYREIHSFDLPLLFSTTSSPEFPHLSSLISESTESPSSFQLFQALESKLQEGSLMLEFGDPEDLNSIYILAHHSNKEALGSFFEGAQLALFSYAFAELFGTDIESYHRYISDLKGLKIVLQRQYVLLKNQLNQSYVSVQQYHQMWINNTNETKMVKQEFELAKSAVNQLNYQLENLHKRVREVQGQDLDCVICRSCTKNIVMFPCGHIVACKGCMTGHLRVDLGRELPSSSTLLCALCKTKVAEVREVFF